MRPVMKKLPDTNKEEQPITSSWFSITKRLACMAILLVGVCIFLFYYQEKSSPELVNSDKTTAESHELASKDGAPVLIARTQIEDGKDVETGLVAGEGLQIVKGTCTACHSSALILQSRFTREEWYKKIVWMQETQGLWELGEHESVILDYLEANYGPEEFRGRRRPLDNIEWYQLKD